MVSNEFLSDFLQWMNSYYQFLLSLLISHPLVSWNGHPFPFWTCYHFFKPRQQSQEPVVLKEDRFLMTLRGKPEVREMKN